MLWSWSLPRRAIRSFVGTGSCRGRSSAAPGGGIRRVAPGVRRAGATPVRRDSGPSSAPAVPDGLDAVFRRTVAHRAAPGGYAGEGSCSAGPAEPPRRTGLGDDDAEEGQEGVGGHADGRDHQHRQLDPPPRRGRRRRHHQGKRRRGRTVRRSRGWCWSATPPGPRWRTGRRNGAGGARPRRRAPRTAAPRGGGRRCPGGGRGARPSRRGPWREGARRAGPGDRPAAAP